MEAYGDAEKIRIDIQYLIEKIPKLVHTISGLMPRGSRRQGHWIKPNIPFKGDLIPIFRKVDTLLKSVERDRGKISWKVNELLWNLRFLRQHTVDSIGLMAGLIRRVAEGKQKGPTTFHYFISKLQRALQYLRVLEKGFEKIDEFRGIYNIFKEIMENLAQISGFPSDDFEPFIGVIGRMYGLESIGTKIRRTKDSIEGAIKKLRGVRRYITFLMSLERLIGGLRQMNHIVLGTRYIEKMIDHAVTFEKFINPIKKYFDSDVKNIRGIFSLVKNEKNGEPSILESLITRIKGELNIDTKSYIRKLKAIQTIQKHLGEIKKKKGEISPANSNIDAITNVESGIDQLEKIRGTIESFSSIATDIESLESTYHFELRTSLDIGGEVKGLMSIISDTRK